MWIERIAEVVTDEVELEGCVNAYLPKHLTIQLLGDFRVVVDGVSVPSSAWRLRTATLLVKGLALAPHYRLHREQLMDLLWPDADLETARSNLRYTLHTARRALASSGTDATGLLVREGDLLVLGSADRVESDVALFEDAVANAWRTRDVQRFREAADRYGDDLLPDDRDDWINERRDMLRTSHLAIVQRLAELDEAASPVRPGPDIPNNLPAPLTHIIGRERELGEVRQLLAGHRLVTLTGPGGVGKTRLAEAVGTASLADFPDGVWLVSLAPLRSADLVMPTIARVLGIRESSETSVFDLVVTHLASRRALLIIDNVEHLLDVAPEIANLLRACRDLQVLATSRVRLQQPDEQVYQLSPLELPPENDLASKRWPEFAAVQLFDERAREVDPSFQLSDETMAAVVGICRRLDGLPLAIELAAARIDDIPLSSLVGQLERRLPVLADGPRDLPERQQTLWNTIAWSYDLLTEGERTLYRWLSVFAGGWTVEAAEAVVGGRVCGEPGFDIAAGLERLADHLIFQETTDVQPRFSMLETIHEYGLDRLETTGEVEDAQQRHAQYFLDLVNRAEPELRGPDQQHWLDRLESEHDNLRSVLRWSGKWALPDASLRLTSAVWRFWMARGHVSEGRGWLANVLATASTVPSDARAKALAGAGVLAIAQGDYAVAREFLEESLAVARAIRNRHLVAWALRYLGIQSLHQGDHERASALLEESLTLFRELEDVQGISSVLHLQGELHMERGALDEAQRCYKESLELWRSLGDRNGISTSLDNLATLAYIRGDYEQATILGNETCELARELGDRRVLATSFLTLGDTALGQGDIDRAHHHYAASLTMAREIEDRVVVISCLDGLACVAVSQSQMEEAARLFGSVASSSDAIGVPRPVHKQRRFENYLATLCKHLEPNIFTAAWTAGQLLTLEEAVAHVQRVTRA